ncbi:hypothetical protein AKJ16_DCAP16099 [Drosera capensis]
MHMAYVLHQVLELTLNNKATSMVHKPCTSRPRYRVGSTTKDAKACGDLAYWPFWHYSQTLSGARDVVCDESKLRTVYTLLAPLSVIDSTGFSLQCDSSFINDESLMWEDMEKNKIAFHIKLESSIDRLIPLAASGNHPLSIAVDLRSPELGNDTRLSPEKKIHGSRLLSLTRILDCEDLKCSEEGLVAGEEDDCGNWRSKDLRRQFNIHRNLESSHEIWVSSQSFLTNLHVDPRSIIPSTPSGTPINRFRSPRRRGITLGGDLWTYVGGGAGESPPVDRHRSSISMAASGIHPNLITKIRVSPGVVGEEDDSPRLQPPSDRTS